MFNKKVYTLSCSGSDTMVFKFRVDRVYSFKTIAI